MGDPNKNNSQTQPKKVSPYTVDVDQVLKQAERIKWRIIKYKNMKSKLAKELFELANSNNLWILVRLLGNKQPKSHGSWCTFSFNWKGRNVTITLDSFSGYLKLMLDGENITLGDDESSFYTYMTKNLGLAEEMKKILEELKELPINKLIQVLDDPDLPEELKAEARDVIWRIIREEGGIDE